MRIVVREPFQAGILMWLFDDGSVRMVSHEKARAHGSAARTAASDAGTDRRAIGGRQRPLDHWGIVGNRMRPVEKRRPRPPRWRRSARLATRRPAPAPRRPAAGRESGPCRAATNSSGPARRDVQRRQRAGPPLRIRERVLNRQPHVGDAKLRDDRPVAELDHRVDDRLRVHDHVDRARRRRRTASAPR